MCWVSSNIYELKETTLSKQRWATSLNLSFVGLSSMSLISLFVFLCVFRSSISSSMMPWWKPFLGRKQRCPPVSCTVMSTTSWRWAQGAKHGWRSSSRGDYLFPYAKSFRQAICLPDLIAELQCMTHSQHIRRDLIFNAYLCGEEFWTNWNWFTFIACALSFHTRLGRCDLQPKLTGSVWVKWVICGLLEFHEFIKYFIEPWNSHFLWFFLVQLQYLNINQHFILFDWLQLQYYFLDGST